MQKKAGVNMSHVKISNRALILNQLKEERKSRKDIANKIKLTPAAVTILVNELMQEGCIVESSHVDDSGNVGRKKVFVKLNKNFRYTLGINIEPNLISVGVANLTSEILKTQDISIDKDMLIDDVIKKISKACKDLLWSLNISKDNVLGAGVGIVGNVDCKEGISKRAYGLWKEEVDLEEKLSSVLELPIVVENNVRALALAEMELTAHRNIKNMIFLKYGPGIGSAIIVNEELYRGSYNNAGEIGHMTIDPNGKECKCGQNGCLELIASIESIVKEIKTEYNRNEYPILSDMINDNIEKIDSDTVIRAYISGEKAINKKLLKAVDYLSIGIVNVMRLFDPNKIVLYGDLPNVDSFIETLIEKVEHITNENNISEKIEKSILNQEKCIGGIVLANKELFFKRGGILE